MHSECFEVWQDNILAFTSKLKDGGKRGKQQWSEKQKVSLDNSLPEKPPPSSQNDLFSLSSRVTCGSSLPTIWQWKYASAVVAR